MDALKTPVFLLFVLLVPVSCEGVVSTDPWNCFLLDGILIIYCIIATVLYFREKLSSAPCVALEVSEHERPEDDDPNRVLEATKRQKKAAKKKKSQSTQAKERDKDPFESVNLSASVLPSSPH